jgi:hypothetical protein
MATTAALARCPEAGARHEARAVGGDSRNPHDTGRFDPHDVEIAQARCGTLQGQLDAVDARMRGGYSAREAAQLWNRWRDLKERLRGARC